MSPASAKLPPTLVAMPLALSSSAASASPDAPVPMTMASVISSNSPPMLSSDSPIFALARAPASAPPTASSGPLSVLSLPRMPLPMAAPPCSPAAVMSGTSESVRFCFMP